MGGVHPTEKDTQIVILERQQLNGNARLASLLETVAAEVIEKYDP